MKYIKIIIALSSSLSIRCGDPQFDSNQLQELQLHMRQLQGTIDQLSNQVNQLTIQLKEQYKEKSDNDQFRGNAGGPRLIQRALAGNVDGVQEMIDAGVNVNFRDDRGRTALMLVILRFTQQTADLPEFESLLEDQLTGECNNENYYYHIIEKLIKAGANVNIKDDYGKNALIYAVQYEHCYIPRNTFQLNRTHIPNYMEILLKAGADINIPDRHGRSALMVGLTDPISIDLKIRSQY
ncbi:MAG: hypothetical protein H6845_00610 [Alphaproteobacteria bacterium]|nr:MAG: hypothetical protein H6845_00610 [Alphaproteobacteria bacterium]